MSPSSVIFDLDGTLIDSAPSILTSMRHAFEQQGVKPLRPLNEDLIGPPLPDTLRSLTAEQHHHKLPSIFETFKAHYDAEGYKSARVYQGVEAMLQQLSAQGLPLHIATNKRIAPTRLILAHLGWQHWFKGVYALDYFQPALKAKALVIEQICNIENQSPQHSLLVGDRAEDAEAASANAMPFILAQWGYGGQQDIQPCFARCRHPSEVIAALTR